MKNARDIRGAEFKDIENMSAGRAIGYACGVLLFFVFIWIACSIGDWKLNVLYVLVPIGLGWASGILFTPQGDPQALQFKAIAGGVAALFSGFIIGRFDPLLEPFKNPATWTPLYQERLMLAIGSFILGALFTSIGRIENLNPFKKEPSKNAQDGTDSMTAESDAAVVATTLPLTPSTTDTAK